ncbi:hypothetical protein B0H11DRAFT_2231876 [Mycena galericulata]|nr:hypothetical protein B0H11DRAFT_2231876 [Mycena galericulata]
MPAHFDADLERLRDIMSDTIPPSTTDRTPEHFFSRRFEISDIERMKRNLRERSSKSADGVDHVSYRKIASIPNEALLTLFNSCVAQNSAPQDWFTTPSWLATIQIAIVSLASSVTYSNV